MFAVWSDSFSFQWKITIQTLHGVSSGVLKISSGISLMRKLKNSFTNRPPSSNMTSNLNHPVRSSVYVWTISEPEWDSDFFFWIEMIHRIVNFDIMSVILMSVTIIHTHLSRPSPCCSVPYDDTVQIINNIDISYHCFALQCRYIREEFITLFIGWQLSIVWVKWFLNQCSLARSDQPNQYFFVGKSKRTFRLSKVIDNKSYLDPSIKFLSVPIPVFGFSKCKGSFSVFGWSGRNSVWQEYLS